MSNTRLSLIAAMARNRVIGLHNRLPWRLPTDMKRFRELTTGHAIIMGRKTFDSLARPLPNRKNIVVTRDSDYRAEGATVVHNIEDAIACAGADPEIFVIGGEQIYRQTLPLASRLYLTLVDSDFEGDAWFPEFDMRDWREVTSEHYPPDANNLQAMSLVTLDRVSAKPRMPDPGA
jgi:dihydrofolate reductase